MYENESSQLRKSGSFRSRAQLVKHEVHNVYLNKARDHPNIDQILNPNRTQEVSLGRSSIEHSVNPDNSLSLTLQMAALAKPHGLLTYNETEKNKQAALFMPRSLLNKKLQHQKQ